MSSIPPGTRDARRLLRPSARRNIKILLIVAVLVLAGFIPYPTQVFPNIVVQIVDPDEQHIPATDAHWRGQTNTALVEGQAPFDATGRLALPARTTRASAFDRCYQDTGIPHKLNPTRASVEFCVPAGYTVNFEATGIMELPDTVWSPLREHGPRVVIDAAAAARGYVDLVTLAPSRDPRTPIRIVLRKLPATNPTLNHNPPNPHF
jgi:hypothetical protein